MSHRYDPQINDRHRQIVMGTILGGSSIIQSSGGKNFYLSMRGRNEKWLRYKAMELNALSSDTPFTNDSTHRWHSMCYPLFGKLHADFYDGKARQLREEKLDYLKDIAFAIWYGDAGEFYKGRIVMNTHIWGETGSKLIVKYFGYLGWNSEIIKQRGCCRVRLDEESSNSLYSLVEPQLPYWFLQEEK
jgi:hypothetical protein